ncbi:phosphotransferase family protein [Aspergillus nomiae NRRL 13137]|uniref:Phosphotransferase family protein n=1 Tax=Aspergillus nomiae NRRL (strain ATCC 15546 / NRRL 13137 / CBS 260.88 / M93) TaxID=1509407 RepID=A0A0L1IZS5_ASPN3|nr:phosphotransferase family protein [Aspergillus nomiae NRRL 13137]KNG85056.1 phosphotransferase family protein [Aspergillus nomiae NRRL 13137]
MMPSCSDLFDYTSGRWMYNDALRHREWRRVFNVPELKRLAASSIRQKEEDVVAFEKLAEGGFNRSFLITMRDNFQFVARIPYPSQPWIFSVRMAYQSQRSTATQLVLITQRKQNIFFMEFVQAQSLGDIWFNLSGKQRTKLIAKLVQLESRLCALRFPTSGSLDYSSDLPGTNKVIVPSSSPSDNGRFCIGPDTSLGLCGLIDWQHRTILPLFLQCVIPDSLQNYGDGVSKSLQEPTLPSNFNELKLEEHVLRRRIVHYASDPWEGDNVTLKSNLNALSRKWVDINGGNASLCPLVYSDTESNECLRLAHAQAEADEQLKICQDLIGVGNEG